MWSVRVWGINLNTEGTAGTVAGTVGTVAVTVGTVAGTVDTDDMTNNQPATGSMQATVRECRTAMSMGRPGNCCINNSKEIPP